MLEKHKDKLTLFSFISSIGAIIAIFTFFFKGFGSIAVESADVDNLKAFQSEQVSEHKAIDSDISEIKGDIKAINQSTSDIKELIYNKFGK